MTPQGWVFLVICWSVLIVSTVWCFYMVLAAPLKSED